MRIRGLKSRASFVEDFKEFLVKIINSGLLKCEYHSIGVIKVFMKLGLLLSTIMYDVKLKFIINLFLIITYKFP